MTTKKTEGTMLGKAMGQLFGGTNKIVDSTSEVIQSKDKKATTGTTNNEKKEDKFDKVLDKWGDSMSEVWDDFCDKLEAGDNEKLKWLSKTILRRLSIEAPIVVGFAFICIVLHLLNMTILPGVSVFLGVKGRSLSLASPLQYIRLFTHIFGHDGLAHLRGNMTHILLVGPSAEAFFGSKEIFQIIIAVAVSTAFAHILIGRENSSQLGASGVVFALILLNSLVSAKRGRIPLSFVLTAFLWMGDELGRLIVFNREDRTSHHAHLVGAFVGTIAGYLIQQQKESEQVRKNATSWTPTLLTKKKD